MNDGDASLIQNLENLRLACGEMGISLQQAIDDKARELKCRAFLKCVPDSRLRAAQVPTFLSLVLGYPPSDDLVERVTPKTRGPRLREDEHIALLKRQLDRCALCGEWLDAVAEPHVDHIMPVSLGGASSLDNYQLLCGSCNQGKANLVDWQLAVPFLYERMSARLRYCVLARATGRCEYSGCTASSLNARMEVVPIIAPSEGGRIIFDNLQCLCETHRLERSNANSTRVSRQLNVYNRRLNMYTRK